MTRYVTEPRVTLISYTHNAADVICFTRQTRLCLSPGVMEEVKNWTEERKLSELKEAAKTIPSSWEFVDFTFLVEDVSRAFTHQCVRTRQACYAQQTMRVLNMSDFDYVVSDRIQVSEEGRKTVEGAVESIKHAYESMINAGLPPEDARGILPTNIVTNIVCKYNLRTFVDLAKSRTGGRTQSEYQVVVGKMIDEVLKVYPWVELFLFGDQGRDYFNDIEEFAKREYPNDLKKKGELLKIVDKMRKGVK